VSPATQLVQHACDVLAGFLELLDLAEHANVPVCPEDLAATFMEITRVGELLRGHTTVPPDPDLEEAFGRYRVLLESLRESMPRLHCRLLLERARLEAQRSHLEAASTWAETTRTTR
jgi:hypothetical protein